jgi:hypothetical protein
VVTIRPLALQHAPAVYAAVDSSRPELACWMVWYQPTSAPTVAAEWVRHSSPAQAAAHARVVRRLTQRNAIRRRVRTCLATFDAPLDRYLTE